MKLLLFSTGFYEYMIELANSMSDITETVLCLPENKLGEKHYELIKPTVTLAPFTLIDYRSIRQQLRMILQIKSIIRKHQPDVIHIQSHGFKQFWLLLPIIRHIPLINTIHDPVPHTGDLLSAPNPFNNRLVNLWSDAVIVHGKLLKEECAKYQKIPAEKIHVVPHGHLGVFQKWRIRDVAREYKTFLFFGRIWPYKGLNFFIEAAELVIQEYTDTRFIIAGHGEDIRPYLQLIRHRENFTILNYRIQEYEIDQLFQQAYAVVLPYTDATQSGVIPIAYYYNCLVIATNVGALPEVVSDQNTGVLVGPRNARSLYEAMRWSLINTAQVSQITSRAKQLTETKLSWKNIAQETYKVYRTTDPHAS